MKTGSIQGLGTRPMILVGVSCLSFCTPYTVRVQSCIGWVYENS